MVIFKKRENESLYLGEVKVTPRLGIKRFFEFGWESEKIDDVIKGWIVGFIDFPEAGDTKINGHILDIAVVKYQFGSDAALWSDPILPIFWRPSITIYGRLRTSNGKVIKKGWVKKSMPWINFIKKVIFPRGWEWIWRSSPIQESDMKLLVGQCLIEVVEMAKYGK